MQPLREVAQRIKKLYIKETLFSTCEAKEYIHNMALTVWTEHIHNTVQKHFLFANDEKSRTFKVEHRSAILIYFCAGILLGSVTQRHLYI